MHLFDTLRSCWPVPVASLIFLLLGLWWRFYEARAMEQCPKSYTWVRQYRTGGFPFRRKLMGSPELHVWALLAALAASVAFFCVRQFFTAPHPFSGSDWILPLCLCVLGAGVVYSLLTLLFDSPWVSLPGTLLFAAAAVRSDGANALLALSLLCLLLYLRAGMPGFPAELLYLASILALALAVSVQPAMLWLVPCFPAVHWYKLLHQLRGRRFSVPKLLAAVAASLAFWALAALLASMLRPFLGEGGKTPLLSFSLIFSGLGTLGREALHNFSFPTVYGTVDLLVEAPLLGFGVWGCCSAWVLAWKRRDARGYFVLAVLTAQVLLWLVTWRCVPILGLTLSTACILRDADLGKKRLSTLLPILDGIAWYLFIHIAAWSLPLGGALRGWLI